MTRVKICGIKTVEQAAVALEAGANYLGFIFYPPSHRHVKPAAVGEIVGACRERFGGPDRWGAVGVFVDVPLDEARAIWMTKVPRDGQADTIEGELLRAVEKLRWEAHGNGNINWDEGFEILIRFLRTHLLDAAIYPDDVVKATVAEVRSALDVEGSIAVIAADASTDRLATALRADGLAVVSPALDSDADGRVTVLPASLAKGLEYGHVIVVEPDEIVRAEPRGLNRLYVVLTRAVSRLSILHTLPLPL